LIVTALVVSGGTVGVVATTAGQEEPVLVHLEVATFGGPYNCDSPPPQGRGRSLPRCVYKPIRASAVLAALDGSGRRVTIRTGNDGRAGVSVPAGRYELRPGPAPRRLRLRTAQLRVVDLQPDRSVDAILDYDTGAS
jgi:hypothetical protein